MLLWWQSVRSLIEGVPYPTALATGTCGVRICYAIRLTTDVIFLLHHYVWILLKDQKREKDGYAIAIYSIILDVN